MVKLQGTLQRNNKSVETNRLLFDNFVVVDFVSVDSVKENFIFEFHA